MKTCGKAQHQLSFAADLVTTRRIISTQKEVLTVYALTAVQDLTKFSND